MQIEFKSLSGTANVAALKGTIVVFASEADNFTGTAGQIDALLSGGLARAAKISQFKAGAAEAVEIIAPLGFAAERVLLVGLGSDTKTRPSLSATRLGASLYAKQGVSHVETVHIFADGAVDGTPAYIAEGMALRSYRFDKYLTKEDISKKPKLSHVTFYVEDTAAASALHAKRSKVAAGARFTKDLISEVPNMLYPESFAAQLKDLEALGIEVDILNEAEMAELGMNALLGVGQGSARGSQLVVMRWNGGKEGDAPLAFVGKGVTFDTGGISLKPGEGMDAMKWDMGGAGIVSGLMKALAGRKASKNVVGVVGLVENMPDGNAQRPGDIVTSMSGQTIEILNTDAEGRLVLADALWYTQSKFEPELIIDLATLTGAMIISLGHEYAGYFTDSDDISDLLFKAGSDTGEKVWRLPLHENYDKLINSPAADMKNIGGRGAGSITAAQFLKRFTNDVPWAHIDVAGMVWSDKEGPFFDKGATGYGVRLLDQFVAFKEQA